MRSVLLALSGLVAVVCVFGERHKHVAILVLMNLVLNEVARVLGATAFGYIALDAVFAILVYVVAEKQVKQFVLWLMAFKMVMHSWIILGLTGTYAAGTGMYLATVVLLAILGTGGGRSLVGVIGDSPWGRRNRDRISLIVRRKTKDAGGKADRSSTDHAV